MKMKKGNVTIGTKLPGERSGCIQVWSDGRAECQLISPRLCLTSDYCQSSSGAPVVDKRDCSVRTEAYL